MPAFLVPRRSGPHRVAAIALFRALLSQCKTLTLDNSRSVALQNLVRNRFKQARHDHSIRRLRLSFEAGYEAIDRLDAAVAGKQDDYDYVLDLLEMAPDKVKQAPVFAASGPIRQSIRKPDLLVLGKYEAPALPGRSLFARPLPLESLSGKRHIPRLFNASGIPVLRVGKPQPKQLSGFLNSRIKQRQARHDLRARLEGELGIANAEDAWESTMVQEYGISVSGMPVVSREPSWTAALTRARWAVNNALNDEKRKNKDMAEMMQGVVDRETDLAHSEKAGKQTAKWKKWLERKYPSSAAVKMPKLNTLTLDP